MLNSIKWYISSAFSLFLMLPKLKKLMKEKKSMEVDKYDKQVFEITSSFADTLLRRAKINVSVTGSENIPENESCLFVSNHQSNVDFAVQMVYLKKPKGFIAKVSIEKIPIVSSWMKEMNSLFLDRSNPKQSARVILDGIKLLKSGKSLVIYPEGTRSKSNKIGEFKDGAFKLATKAGVKIVPITINGTYKALEENNSKIKPADVTLIIHTPISTCDLSKDEIKELPEKVFKIISSSL